MQSIYTRHITGFRKLILMRHKQLLIPRFKPI